MCVEVWICALSVCVEVWICALSVCQCVFKCVDTTRKALQSVRMVGCSPEGRVDRNSLLVNENCEGKCTCHSRISSCDETRCSFNLQVLGWIQDNLAWFPWPDPIISAMYGRLSPNKRESGRSHHRREQRRVTAIADTPPSPECRVLTRAYRFQSDKSAF